MPNFGDLVIKTAMEKLDQKIKNIESIYPNYTDDVRLELMSIINIINTSSQSTKGKEIDLLMAKLCEKKITYDKKNN